MKSLSIVSSLLFTLFVFWSSTHISAQEQTDAELVHAAVEDYVLGLYDVAPERIARSVDTSLHKIGYYQYKSEDYNHVPMTYQQLYDLAGKWNVKGDQADDNSPQDIEIYEIFSKTATARLSAVWGIDLMHLSKVDGRWKIMNIMWQSYPQDQ